MLQPPPPGFSSSASVFIMLRRWLSPIRQSLERRHGARCSLCLCSRFPSSGRRARFGQGGVQRNALNLEPSFLAHGCNAIVMLDSVSIASCAFGSCAAARISHVHKHVAQSLDAFGLPPWNVYRGNKMDLECQWMGHTLPPGRSFLRSVKASVSFVVTRRTCSV